MDRRPLLRPLLLLAAFFVALPVTAETVPTPQLLANIRADDTTAGSEPDAFVVYQGAVYFVATDAAGTALFRTMGEPEDVEVVVRFRSIARRYRLVVRPQDGDFLVLLDGELWRTDRTDAGTRQLWRGVSIEAATAFVPGTDTWVFVERSYIGWRLWASDGTSEGTRLLLDGDFTEVIGIVATTSDRVAFAVQDLNPSFIDPVPDSVWSTDGTQTGTVRLADAVEPFTAASDGEHLVFFRRIGGSYFGEPWVSDGTPEGTRSLVPSFSGGCDASPWHARIRVAGGYAYVVANAGPASCGLWRVRLVDGDVSLVPIQISPLDEHVSVLGQRTVTTGDRRWLFYTAASGAEESGPVVVDAATGTATYAGTLAPGALDVSDAYADADRIVLFGGAPFFLRVWESDGTPAGTTSVASSPLFHELLAPPTMTPEGGYFFTDLDGLRQLWRWRSNRDDGAPVGPPWRAPISLQLPTVPAALGEGLVFAPEDPMIGREPWASDGTDGGTRPISDLQVGDHGAAPRDFLPFADRLAFLADTDADRTALWVTDGTPAGTVELDLGPSAADVLDGPLATLGDRLLFVTIRTDTDGGRIRRLWATTADGPRLLLEADSSSFTDTTTVGDRLLFRSNDRLWSTDGTADGTIELNVPVSTLGASPPCPPVVGGCLLFDRQAVWRTDGTPAGTVRIATFADVFIVRSEATSPGRVWFETTEPDDGVHTLWTTDGTGAGTVPVTSFVEIPFWLLVGDRIFGRGGLGSGGRSLWVLEDDEPRLLRAVLADPTFPFGPNVIPFDDRLLFFDGDDLWVTDGTLDGTFEVLRPPAESLFEQVVVVDELAYVIGLADELWVTDGTVGGTRRLADLPVIAPAPLDGLLVFRSAGGGTWRSDGTEAGTFQIWPASLQAAARPIPVNGHLVMPWYQPTIGVELHTVPKTALAAPDERLPLTVDDRFRATVSWTGPDGTVGRGRAVPVTDDTGTFWFFSDDNLELMVKILDGRAINGHWWVFYASLSNVAYELLVEDTQTGEVAVYDNPPDAFASRGDTEAFVAGTTAGLDGLAGAAHGLAAAAELAHGLAPRADTDCGVPGALCFQDDRFAVTVTWRTDDGDGTGTPVALAGESGAFSFFDPNNLELLVKILDGRAINGRWWVFYGSLSDVAYEVLVQDLETGAEKRYANDAGTFASRGDTDAF